MDSGSAPPVAAPPLGRPDAAQEPPAITRRNSAMGCFGGGATLDGDELGPSPGLALTDSASDSEPVMPAGLVGIRNLGECGRACLLSPLLRNLCRGCPDALRPRSLILDAALCKPAWPPFR